MWKTHFAAYQRKKSQPTFVFCRSVTKKHNGVQVISAFSTLVAISLVQTEIGNDLRDLLINPCLLWSPTFEYVTVAPNELHLPNDWQPQSDSICKRNICSKEKNQSWAENSRKKLGWHFSGALTIQRRARINLTCSFFPPDFYRLGNTWDRHSKGRFFFLSCTTTKCRNTTKTDRNGITLKKIMAGALLSNASKGSNVVLTTNHQIEKPSELANAQKIDFQFFSSKKFFFSWKVSPLLVLYPPTRWK